MGVRVNDCALEGVGTGGVASDVKKFVTQSKTTIVVCYVSVRR